tara:strand:- start:51120 stop:51299 length:180 start_codon:yes stop_codon:yes gene_type:complete
MLAAAMAAMPGCSDEEVKPALDASVDAAPVYGIAADATPDEDGMRGADADITIYGIAPE